MKASDEHMQGKKKYVSLAQQTHASLSTAFSVILHKTIHKRHEYHKVAKHNITLPKYNLPPHILYIVNCTSQITTNSFSLPQKREVLGMHITTHILYSIL